MTAWIVGGTFAVLIVSALALTVRLATGPIEASVPQSLLDRVVAEAAPGWRVTAEGAQLDFSSDDGLNGLKLRDVELFDPEGTTVVSAPLLGLRFALSASLDPRKALTVREVALRGASVDVIRDANGAFQLELGDLSTETTGDSDHAASLESLGALGALPRLRIEDAHVRYTDQARGATWRTDNALLLIDPTDEGLSGTLALEVDGGVGGARLEAFHTSDTGQVTATLTLQGVRPSRVSELDPILAPLARIDAPLSGTLEVRADDGGTFQRVAGLLTASEGVLHIADGPTALRSFAAAFSCDVAAEGCDIADLSVETDVARASLHGTVRRSAEQSFAVALQIDNALGQIDEIAASIGTTAFSGTIDAVSGLVTLDHAAFDDLGLKRVADGSVLTVKRAEAAGTYDPSSGQLALPRLELAAMALTDADGARQSFASLTGAASVDTAKGQVIVRDIAANEVIAAFDGTALTIAQAKAVFIADIHAQRVQLETATLDTVRVTPPGQAPVSIAAASLTGAVDLKTQTFSDGALRVRDAVLPLPDLYAAPVRVAEARGTLAATSENGVSRITLKNATARIDGLPVKAQGNFAFRADGTALGRLDASLGPVAFADVPRHWPNGVAPGGKRWVAQNIKQGISDTLTISAQFDEARPNQDSLDLRFSFRDAAVTFAPGMPPIQKAAGQGHVTLDRFDLSLAEGSVASPQAGTLALNGSSFAIADFEPSIPDGQVKLRATGSVQSVLRLLDNEPLGVISPTGFDIASVKGEADVRVLLDLPLADDLLMDDVRFDARAKVREYRLKEPQTGLDISGDLLLVKATGDGLTLQSDARIDGLVARLGYSQGFAKPAPGTPDSVLTLDSFLSLGDFARHGLVLDDYLEGMTAVKARIELFRGGVARINADADLTNAALKAQPLGWAKAAGVPATIKLSGFRNPDGAGRLEAIALRGDGLSADGSIGFGGDGQITRADFSRIQLGSAVDVGVTFGRKTNGNVGILLTGAQIDLRRAFADAIEGDAPAQPPGRAIGPQTDVSLQVGRAFLRDDLGIFDLRGGIRLRGGALHAANIAGKLNGSAATRLLAERRETGIAIRLTAPDAGAFVRATDIFSGAYDGTLTLDAVTRDSDGPTQISGRMLIENIVLHDAPTLRKILKDGAIASLMRDLANGGIAFQKIELPFQGVGPRWQIQNGVAFGPALGLTLEGSYDIARSDLDLNGSVSPAYAINGALGNVPLLGKLLTGGEGEGVFGVTFSVDGNSNKPSVSVNPLSALAPGFLRRIVAEVGKGGERPSRGQNGTGFNAQKND